MGLWGRHSLSIIISFIFLYCCYNFLKWDCIAYPIRKDNRVFHFGGKKKKRQMCNELLNAKLAGWWPRHFQWLKVASGNYGVHWLYRNDQFSMQTEHTSKRSRVPGWEWRNGIHSEPSSVLPMGLQRGGPHNPCLTPAHHSGGDVGPPCRAAML